MSEEKRDYQHEAKVGRVALKRVIYALKSGKMTVKDAQIAAQIDGAATILGISEAEMEAFTLWQKGLKR